MVERKVKSSPGQRREGAIIGSKRFRNVSGSGELIVRDGIDARGGPKRIDEQRGAAARRRRGANCAIVEVQRTRENVCLPSIVTLNIEYEIPRRLVSVRKSSRGRDRIGVKKLSVRDAIKRGLMFLRIPDGAQVRDQPPTGTGVVAI